MVYDPFTTTSTTTIPPVPKRSQDVIKSDSELYGSDIAEPKQLYDNAHPVSTAEEDIDPRDKQKNTIPYQETHLLTSLLERAGIPTIWERAFPCPCFDPISQQPRPDCPLCHGKGLLYKDPEVLQVAYQSNSKNPYNGSFGVEDLGTTSATPQHTESGIENGISFRDRLTITGLTIEQTFMFNVTTLRINNGMAIPYLVNKFNGVYSMENNKLVELSLGIKDKLEDNQYFFDSSNNKMYISSNLKDSNVTMSISSPLRYYVVDVAKETRYAQVKKTQQKQAMMNYGDKALTNYMNDHSDIADKVGTAYFRVPKLLVLRREDMYIPVTDMATDDNKETSKQLDPKPTYESHKSISDFLGN